MPLSPTHKTAIGVFLALVLGVVLLQGMQGRKDTASVTQTPPPVVQDVCGDGQCTGQENCNTCGQDCGACQQAYCCSTQNYTCDGPFNVQQNGNPCQVANYDPTPFLFPNGDAGQRSSAFSVCSQVCVPPQQAQ